MATAILAAKSFPQGSTWRGRLRIVTNDTPAVAKDLTAATARWALYDGVSVVAGPYEVGSGILIEDATGGVIVVEMTDAVTEPLCGAYRQEWRIVDAAGDVQKYVGAVNVYEARLEAA